VEKFESNTRICVKDKGTAEFAYKKNLA